MHFHWEVYFAKCITIFTNAKEINVDWNNGKKYYEMIVLLGYKCGTKQSIKVVLPVF